jgi:exonuclease VII small subunit
MLITFSFQSFSSCVHSTWNHISRFNSRPSSSALHRHTFIAEMPEFQPDIHQLDTVARRLDETINLFQKYLKLTKNPHMIEKWLDEKLEGVR